MMPAFLRPTLSRSHPLHKGLLSFDPAGCANWRIWREPVEDCGFSPQSGCEERSLDPGEELTNDQRAEILALGFSSPCLAWCVDRPLEQSTWASSSDKDLALFENNSLQANCKSEALTLSMAKEVGEVAKRLGATFVDLHTALMCPDVNRRAALRLEASNAVLAKKSLIKDLVLLRTKLMKWSFFGPFLHKSPFFSY